MGRDSGSTGKIFMCSRTLWVVKKGEREAGAVLYFVIAWEMWVLGASGFVWDESCGLERLSTPSTWRKSKMLLLRLMGSSHQWHVWHVKTVNK